MTYQDDGLTRAQVEITKQLTADIERLTRERDDARWAIGVKDKQIVEFVAAHDAAQAENERLRALLDTAIDLLCGSQSGFTSGTQPDCEWRGQKDALLRAIANVPEQGHKLNIEESSSIAAPPAHHRVGEYVADYTLPTQEELSAPLPGHEQTAGD